MAKPEVSSNEEARKKSLPAMMPTFTLVMTTIKNIRRGPRSMVPSMLRPASGIRYGGSESRTNALASAVKSIKIEAASRMRMRAFLRSILLPNRSRKYQTTHISVATTIPTPRKTVQGLAPPEKGRTSTPIRKVSDAHTMNSSATYRRTRGRPSSQVRSFSKRDGGR